MSEAKIDYGQDAQQGPGDNILATIDFLANQLLDAEADVEAKEEALRLAKEHARDLAECQLPEVMDTARQKELTTASGVRLKLKDMVRASIPEARKAQAFSWLRERDHGAIIKTKLVVPFEAGRDPAAQGLQHVLVLLSTMESARGVLMEHLLLQLTKDEERELVKAAFSFLAAIGNEAHDRLQLDSSVHAQTLAALVRELLRDGKIDPQGMAEIGAHAWKQASVERRGK